MRASQLPRYPHFTAIAADFKLDAADVWFEKHLYEDALYFAECAKVGTAHLIPREAKVR